MSDAAELRHAAFGLRDRIVSGSDGPHAGGLVAGVCLGAVLEVGIGSTGAVDAYVAIGVVDVGASVGFGHDRHDGDARCGSYWFGFEVGEEVVTVGYGDGLENVGEAGDSLYFILFGSLGFKFGEVECGARVVCFHECSDNVGYGQGVGMGWVDLEWCIVLGTLGTHGEKQSKNRWNKDGNGKWAEFTEFNIL